MMTKPIILKEESSREYVCYCAKVAESDIQRAVNSGASTVDEVIILTGAMTNSNCKVNNPMGKCCYKDIVAVFEQCQNEDQS